MTATLLIHNSKVQNSIIEYVYHIYYIVCMKYSDNTMLNECKKIHRLWRKERKMNIFPINVFFSMMIFPGNDNDDDRLHKLFELLAQLR